MLEEVKHVKSLGNNLPEQFLKCVWWVVVGGGVEKGEKNTKKKKSRTQLDLPPEEGESH